MLTEERIMFHYSLLGDSNVEGSFYFLEGVAIFNKLGLDCSKLGEDNPG